MNNMIYQVKQRPPFGKNLVFAFQQMIAIMAATLLVPILVSSKGLQCDPRRRCSERVSDRSCICFSRDSKARYSSDRLSRSSARFRRLPLRTTVTGA